MSKHNSEFNYLIGLREKVNFFVGLVKFGVVDSSNNYILNMYNDCILILAKIEKNLDSVDNAQEWLNSIHQLDIDFQLNYFKLYKSLKKEV